MYLYPNVRSERADKFKMGGNNMKKRLLCLLMCLIMVMSVVLTGCSEKTDEEATDDIKDKASEAAMTLRMWWYARKRSIRITS